LDAANLNTDSRGFNNRLLDSPMFEFIVIGLWQRFEACRRPITRYENFDQLWPLGAFPLWTYRDAPNAQLWCEHIKSYFYGTCVFMSICICMELFTYMLTANASALFRFESDSCVQSDIYSCITSK